MICIVPRWLRRLLLPGLVLLLLLSGCGFHLRGWDLDESIQAVFIAAADNSTSARTEVAAELRSAFAQAGVTIAQQRSDADLIVVLLDQRRNRRSVAVTGQARAAEYELSRAVQFSVERPDGQGHKTLIPPRWIQVERVVRVDRDNLVGGNQEQALVERELGSDMIAQILRSINLVLSQQSTGSG